MSAQQAEPLPECLGCDRPTKRTTYTANGGLCSDCRADVESGRFRTLPLIAIEGPPGDRRP